MWVPQQVDQRIINFCALYQAWQACQKRKAGKAAAQKYQMRLLDNLWNTLFSLQAANYQATASYCFVTLKPKLREIHAAHFGDRVVHHYLVPKLEALWEPWFIHDVYSNRKNKGTHKAVQRCQNFMRKADAGYFLQLDIQNFFYSIDQSILIRLLEKGLQKALKQSKINLQQASFYKYLCQTFIQADFSKTYELTPQHSANLPVHKQLKQQPKGQGLPIGNLTSQFFANVYLNELDQYIKHQLKCRYYVRFVDDFILMADNAEQLKNWHQKIGHFVKNQLGLNLKPQYQLKAVASGADFLGYIVRPYYLLVRRRVVANLKTKLRAFEQQWVSRPTPHSQHTHWQVCSTQVDQLRAVLASYIGHFKHASSLKLIQSLWQTYPWLNYLFSFDAQHYQLTLKTTPPKTAGYKQQLAFFRNAYPNAKLDVQFGTQRRRYLPQATTPQYTVKIQQAGYNQLGLRQRKVKAIVSANAHPNFLLLTLFGEHYGNHVATP